VFLSSIFLLLFLWYVCFKPTSLFLSHLSIPGTLLNGNAHKIDLLVPTSLGQVLLICKHHFLFDKASYLNEEVLCIESFPSVSVPGSISLSKRFSKESKFETFFFRFNLSPRNFSLKTSSFCFQFFAF
jgi:hypothetical protein